MTKVNQETIVAIGTELNKIGNSFSAIGEYLKTFGANFPSIEAVLPPVTEAVKKVTEVVDTKQVPADVVVEEEVAGNVIETEDGEVNLDEMSIPDLKKFAKEYEIEVPARGKDKIIEAIMEAINGEDEESEDEEETDEAVEEVDSDEDDSEEDEEGVDIDELSKDELISFIEENELGDAPKKKKTEKLGAYETRLREFIYEALDVEDEEAVEEEEGEVETGEEERSTVIETEDGEVDLSEMTVKELKKFAKEYEIEITEKKAPGIIEEILDALYAEDGEEEGEDDTDEEDSEDLSDEYGLNDMEVEDLAELLEEHGLSTKGKKQALVDRVLKGIEDGTIELEEEEGE